MNILADETESKLAEAAYHMERAYRETSRRGDAVDAVSNHMKTVDTLTLVAMWTAIDAYCDINHS